MSNKLLLYVRCRKGFVKKNKNALNERKVKLKGPN